MMAAVADSMLARTGRTLPEWIALVAAEGPDAFQQNDVRRWLRKVHGVPQNSQWAIADAAAVAAGWVRPDVAGYTDQVYAGSKAALRPLHEQVAAVILRLGDDVRAEGRSTYIPFVRKRQFVALAPGPRGTLRIGVRYRQSVPEDVRLSPAKGFAQASHVLHLAGDADDAEVDTVRPLLQIAYEQNG